MATEILKYFYTREWNIEILKDLPFSDLIDHNFPLVVSSMSTYKIDSITKTYTNYLNDPTKKISPTTVLDSWNGAFNRRIGEYLGCERESLLINSNCSSSLYGFYIADLLSKEKKTPVILVCADNVNNEFDLWRFEKIGAMDNSTGNPFDKESKGFRMGVGISVFLVKNSRVKFPSPAISVINRYSFYTINTLTNPGKVDDLLSNLYRFNYKKFDFWNAHAPGTPLGDNFEYEYFQKTIKKDIPIVSFKTYLGHCMTASGAMELAFSLECRDKNILLPNFIPNAKIVDDDRIITEKTSFSYRRMFKTTLGFGGKFAVADISFV
jgi:3-oxoacyl-(acyl-carrier-protein) synthase